MNVRVGVLDNPVAPGMDHSGGFCTMLRHAGKKKFHIQV